MKKLVFEYQDTRGSHVSIHYDSEKNFYVNEFNSAADNSFREWMYRVSTRLNEYLRKGVGPDDISMNITRNKDSGVLSVNYEVLKSDFDVDVYITKSNEVVFRNHTGRSNFVHVTEKMRQAIAVIREELAAKSNIRTISPADIVLVDSADSNTDEAGVM
jgi:hypothetical protein